MIGPTYSRWIHHGSNVTTKACTFAELGTDFLQPLSNIPQTLEWPPGASYLGLER